jgi:hypothetical protein
MLQTAFHIIVSTQARQHTHKQQQQARCISLEGVLASRLSHD